MTADLGILFVHGIGNQTRGETLVAFGEPLFEALKDRVNFGNEIPDPQRSNAVDEHSDKVRVTDGFLSSLVEQSTEFAEPAHVRLNIAANQQAVPIEWIMAECHWANSFPPPSSRTVTLWIMQFLPWIFVSFFTRRISLAVGTIRSQSGQATYRPLEIIKPYAIIVLLALVLPFTGPIALLLELCLIALLVVDLVPIKAIQDFVTRINAAFSAVLGDSFVFASSTFRQRGVISKLLSDLAWLQKRCKHLVVIAHSQGAAVSYLALKGRHVDNVKLLVTFGSGILKLHQLERRGERESNISLVSIMVIVAAVFEILIPLEYLDLSPYTPGVIGKLQSYAQSLMVIVYLIGLVSIALEENTESIQKEALAFKERGLKWIDLYASMDPVPNGPCVPGSTDLDSVELCNRSSVVADHTSYTENRDEFLPLVVDAIAEHCETEVKLRQRGKGERLKAAISRRIRIGSENFDHAVLVATLVLFLAKRDIVNSVGASVTDWVNDGCIAIGAGANCWKWSAVTTGVGAALAGFILLRMGVQALHSSVNARGRSKNSGFAHIAALLALTIVALLYLPEDYQNWKIGEMSSTYVKLQAVPSFAGVLAMLVRAFGLWRFRQLDKHVKNIDESRAQSR